MTQEHGIKHDIDNSRVVILYFTMVIVHVMIQNHRFSAVLSVSMIRSRSGKSDRLGRHSLGSDLMVRNS